MSQQPQFGCWGVSSGMGHRPGGRLGLLTVRGDGYETDSADDARRWDTGRNHDQRGVRAQL